MSGAKGGNLAQSIQARLKNAAAEGGRPFIELLELYAVERFLHRLGRSRQRDRFVLKGAMLLRQWLGAQTRPTRDIDLLGPVDLDGAALREAIVDILRTKVENDAIAFAEESITVQPIRGNSAVLGLRAKFDAALVYVTTQLAGLSTRFLPFNRGKFGGAGNPPVPLTGSGYATDYLWNETWARDSVLDLVRQFIHEVERDRRAAGKAVRADRGRGSLVAVGREHQEPQGRAQLGIARSGGSRGGGIGDTRRSRTSSSTSTCARTATPRA